MHRQFVKKLKKFSWSPATIATSFVGFFTMLGLFITFAFVVVKVQTQSAGNFSQQRIVFSSIIFGCGGLGATLLVAPLLGWVCSLPFMRRTVKEAVPSAVVMREFGLQDDGILMGFIRSHKLDVYRTRNRLPDAPAYNVPALLEALFPLWLYFPLLPSRYFGRKTICFDRAQVEPLKQHYLSSLAAAMPEALQAASDREKDLHIEALQAEVLALKEAGASDRRELKKHLAAVEKTAMEHLLLGYAGMRLISQFLETRHSNTPESRQKVTIQRINEALDALRHEQPELNTQLSLWQRPDKKEQNQEFYDFLRLALPKEMVNWGGYEMTVTMAVDKYCRNGKPHDAPSV